MVHRRASFDTGIERIRCDAGEIVVDVALRARDGVDLTADGGVPLAVAVRAVQGDFGDLLGIGDGVVLQ